MAPNLSDAIKESDRGDALGPGKSNREIAEATGVSRRGHPANFEEKKKQLCFLLLTAAAFGTLNCVFEKMVTASALEGLIVQMGHAKIKESEPVLLVPKVPKWIENWQTYSPK